jgi:hypothetical protein
MNDVWYDTAKKLFQESRPLVISNHKNYSLVLFYILASELYYRHDKSLLDDCDYDLLCKHLHDNFDALMNDLKLKNSHKKYLDKELLKSGSGYSIMELEPELYEISLHLQRMIC